MAKQGAKIGRVCPVVRQQCRLARGCALFDAAVTDVKDLDDKARAWRCPQRGAYVFNDELKARRFLDDVHSADARISRAFAEARRTQTLRRKRDQLALPIGEEVAAAAAT